MKTLCRVLLCGLLLCRAFGLAAQVPAMSSYPSATSVIFLDFDGHYVVGSAWNYSGSINCDGANLTTTQIVDVYNRVAEDYRPFTVNVTTDSTLYWSASPTNRMRLILTTSSSWFGSAGGVAYVNSFTWGDHTPCFVFTALLGYNTKNIAEAASHEAGHTLGLRHQSSYDAMCNKVSEYNPGTGSGETAWAPIMGVGYYRNFTLWNYGANPYGCTSLQDDLSLITRSVNGISYRPDDHKEDKADATVAPFISNTFHVAGLIEKPQDVDAVTFTLPANGKFTLDAIPYGIASGNTGANVDLEVELLNAAETSLGIYNSAATLHTTIDTLLPAGTYYLRVQGRGNSFAPNYASLGSYTLKGSFYNNEALPLHKLQLKATAESGRHRLDWEIVADEKVVDQIIEASSDGRRFTALSTALPLVRTYTALPSAQSLHYYRLNVRFDNGRQHYSNVVALRNSETSSTPYLLGNPVSAGTLSVNSPSAFNYSIHDLNGRQLQSGVLKQGLNTLPIRFESTGVYIIHYKNNHNYYSEKFMHR